MWRDVWGRGQGRLDLHEELTVAQGERAGVGMRCAGELRGLRWEWVGLGPQAQMKWQVCWQRGCFRVTRA